MSLTSFAYLSRVEALGDTTDPFPDSVQGSLYVRVHSLARSVYKNEMVKGFGEHYQHHNK
jgi:hypothetical protein